MQYTNNKKKQHTTPTTIEVTRQRNVNITKVIIK